MYGTQEYIDCRFENNVSVRGSGGAMANIDSETTLINCVMQDNSSKHSVAGVYLAAYPNPISTKIYNCTIVNNQATYPAPCSGVGILMGYRAQCDVSNSIVWGNQNATSQIAGGDAEVSYSVVEGGFSGVANLDVDPLLDATGHLLVDSPCIDAGALLSDLPSYDMDGWSRVVDGNQDGITRIDIGADETDFVPPATVWVDDDWSNLEEGDLIDGHRYGYDAFSLIQPAIDIAATNAQIHVAAGVYRENLELEKEMEILGADPEACSINGSANGRVINVIKRGTTTRLDGFTFVNGQADTGGGVYLNQSNISISNCRFQHNSADYGAGLYIQEGAPQIVQCIFFANHADQDGGGLYLDNTNVTMINCTLLSNIADNADGGGIALKDSTLNCINRILWDNRPLPVHAISNNSISITCSDVERGYTGFGNIDADPLFEDVIHGDIRLRDGSPCIDVGNNEIVPAWLTTDFHGDPRITDGDENLTCIVEMGADERPQPTEVWVNYCWLGEPDGTVVPGGHVIGYDAFALIQDGIDRVYVPGTVYVAPATYPETITLKNGAYLLGEDMDSTIIDGKPNAGVVTAINLDASTRIENFTLTGGDTKRGGALLCQSSSLQLKNCIFHTNQADMGGALCIIELSEPTIINCCFYDNQADRGATIYIDNSQPVITHCTLYHNISDQEGGALANFNLSDVTVANSILWDNTPDQIYNSANSNCTITYSNVQRGYLGQGNIDKDPDFVDAAHRDLHLKDISTSVDSADNTAPSIPSEDADGLPRIADGDRNGIAVADMGAFEIAYVPPTTIWVDDDWAGLATGTAVQGHYIGYDAFGRICDGLKVAEAGATVQVEQGIYAENLTAKNGIALLGADPKTTIIDGSDRNTAIHFCDVNEDTVLAGFSITHGYSPHSGGGMYFERANPKIYDCRIYNNVAALNGGGFYAVDSAPCLANCYIYDNQAEFGAAGFIQNDSGKLIMVNCTLTQNQAGKSAGGLFLQNAASEITNTIVWGNQPEAIIEDNNSNAIITYCDIERGYPGVGNFDHDPLFVEPDTDDFHLLRSSYCLDNGTNEALPAWLILDPDGDSRIIDGDCGGPVAVDVGADEYTLAKHGDLNCDCIVNLLDFAIVSEAWLSQPDDPLWNQNCDWIPNQIIDLQDMEFLLENWLQSP